MEGLQYLKGHTLPVSDSVSDEHTMYVLSHSGLTLGSVITWHQYISPMEGCGAVNITFMTLSHVYIT